MKRSRFTDSQILAILKEAECGMAVLEVCRTYGISSATFYKWRAKFGGMDVSMMSRLKELEEETPVLRLDVIAPAKPAKKSPAKATPSA